MMGRGGGVDRVVVQSFAVTELSFRSKGKKCIMQNSTFSIQIHVCMCVWQSVILLYFTVEGERGKGLYCVGHAGCISGFF